MKKVSVSFLMGTLLSLGLISTLLISCESEKSYRGQQRNTRSSSNSSGNSSRKSSQNAYGYQSPSGSVTNGVSSPSQPDAADLSAGGGSASVQGGGATSSSSDLVSPVTETSNVKNENTMSSGNPQGGQLGVGEGGSGSVSTSHVSGTSPVSSTSSNIPYGTPVPGKPGFVTSPHAPYAGYVDVRGFPPNTEVKDPYSGKIFLVP